MQMFFVLTRRWGMDGWQGTPVPEEEIRFAVVLNGGVSLAVWMGGVVRELDRVTWSGSHDPPSPYGPLLRMVGCRARADVIAGTSAGGINGAALALAQVNRHADLGLLRDLWADQGRIESLLRQPFKGSPSSLLKGDEYFLPQLRDALRRLVANYDPFPPDERPIDLTITTTLLNGTSRKTVDALGQLLTQNVHEGQFTFGWDTPSGGPTGGAPREEFAGTKINETVRRLAVAARCSAGFPVAFEPSFVPIGETPVTLSEPDSLPVDMTSVASWATGVDPEVAGRDRSRFVVDGGVLVNTPTRAALEAINRLAADGPVRRVMLLVFPHAVPEVDDRADARAAPPTLSYTLARIQAAQASQGGRTHVEEIERHNLLAASRRGSRLDLLKSIQLSTPLGERPDGRRWIYDTVDDLYVHYRMLRIHRAARDLGTFVAGKNGWPYERIRASAKEAQERWLTRAGRLPYVSDIPPPAGIAAIVKGGGGWGWGITTAEHLADAVADVLRRLVWCTSAEHADRIGDLRKELHEVRSRLRELRATIDDPWLSDPDLTPLVPNTDYWTLRLAAFGYAMLPCEDVGRPDAVRPDWDATWAIVRGHLGDTGEIGERIRAQVVLTANVAVDAAALLQQYPFEEGGPDPLGVRDLAPWRALMCAGPTPWERREELKGESLLLSRLLGLEILTACVGDEFEIGAHLPVELVQISLQTANASTQYTVTPDDKGAGMAIARFSGFLKQSWRINDWTWGRIDAATMLCRIILDPVRLRRVAVLDGRFARKPDGVLPEKVCQEVVKYLPDPTSGINQSAMWYAAETVRDVFRGMFDTKPSAAEDIASYLGVPAFEPRLRQHAVAAVAELIAVFDPSVPLNDLPRSATNLADLAAWALHLDIAVQEVPVLARAVSADRVEGANVRSRGEMFVSTNKDLIDKINDTPSPSRPGESDARVTADERRRLGPQALAAFDRAGIGHESLAEEATSDQMIRTAVTAMGVAVTVLDGNQFGVTAAKPVTKVLRGAALLPYWAVTGLTRGGATARFLSILAVAIGGVLIVLALFGTLPGWGAGPAAALGGGTLLGVFGYAALRSGTLVHGLVLLSPVIPLFAYAITDAKGPAAAQQGASVLVVISVVVAGLAILASLPSPVAGPWTALRRRWWVPVVVVPAIALAVAFPPTVLGWLSRIVGWLVGLRSLVWPWPALSGLTLLLIVSLVLCGRWTRALRLWQRDPTSGRWRIGHLVHPVAMSAMWCVVYGVTYALAVLALSHGLSDRTWRPWEVAAMATGVSFAAELLLWAPWWLPLRASRHIARQLVSEATVRQYTGTESIEKGLGSRLVARGQAYRFLVNGFTDDTPKLTFAGRRVAIRIANKLSGQRASS